MAKWTHRESAHLNGGGAFWKGEVPFSETTYAVYRDDKPTTIMRFTRTDGEDCRRTVDVLTCGADEFNLLGSPGLPERLAWLEAHATAPDQPIAAEAAPTVDPGDKTSGGL